MELFVWVVVVLCALEIAVQLFCLTKGIAPPRKPAVMAMDFAIMFLLAAWGVALIATN